MTPTVTINPRIVEALYCEALVLSDEVRTAFAVTGRLEPVGPDHDRAHIAMSSEGLRTTTRMMHCLAWLLNHRAFFMGEINHTQLRRHGRLPVDTRRGDPEELALLKPEVAELVARGQNFYDRLLRLEGSWSPTDSAHGSTIKSLQEHIEQRLAS